MGLGFVIMQIGNPTLDGVYDEVIAPAIRAADLEPRRVDRDNTGDLLKSEIVRFILEAEIVVADVTNERPNCYLEIGYAMGAGRNRYLLLTARQDHLPTHPDFDPDGPKVHFDLAGYDILFWDPEDLDRFREELTARIQRRLLRHAPPPRTETPRWDEDWNEEHRARAVERFERTGFGVHWEVTHAVPGAHLDAPQDALVTAAHASEIRTFGWPIGVTLLNRDDLRPRPTVDGIVAEVLAERAGGSFDYWALRRDGQFFLLKSLFEDLRSENEIFVNTRVVRTAEAILHAQRLYDQLGVDGEVRVFLRSTYRGLRGRQLGSSNPMAFIRTSRSATEDEVSTEIDFRLQDVESHLIDLVEKVVAPLLILFDFFRLERGQLERLVNEFVAGRVR